MKSNLPPIQHAISFFAPFLHWPSLLNISMTCQCLKDMVDKLLLLDIVAPGVNSRKYLADMCATFHLGGYCTPFHVCDSPNALGIEYRTGIFEECFFRAGDQCQWSGFEDTYKMMFHNVNFPGRGSGGDEDILVTPESVAALFRRFYNPLYDQHHLLNSKTLQHIGQLLPDDHYVARWCQLSVFNRADVKCNIKAMERMCNLNSHYSLSFHPYVSKDTHFEHLPCIGYLYCPRAPLPNSYTRNKVLEWSQRECHEGWHAPWRLHASSPWLLNEMDAKYGFLGKTCGTYYLKQPQNIPADTDDADDTGDENPPLPFFTQNSYHWPTMNAILPTQPADKLNEATVETYMELLLQTSADYARPTVLLLEVTAHSHRESYYFCLDGHHKLEALKRLVSLKGVAVDNPRLNFLIISRSVPTDNANVGEGTYFDKYQDEYSGVEEHETLCASNGELLSPDSIHLATEYHLALKTLHDQFEVTSVVEDIISMVNRDALDSLKVVRIQKNNLVKEIVGIRSILSNSGLEVSVPQIEWKKNPLLEAGPNMKQNKWTEINNPRWYDSSLTELQVFLDELKDLCTLYNLEIVRDSHRVVVEEFVEDVVAGGGDQMTSVLFGGQEDY